MGEDDRDVEAENRITPERAWFAGAFGGQLHQLSARRPVLLRGTRFPFHFVKIVHSSTTRPLGNRQTPYTPRGPLRISLLPPLLTQNTAAGLGSAQAGGGAKASPKESEKNIIAWLIRPPDHMACGHLVVSHKILALLLHVAAARRMTRWPKVNSGISPFPFPTRRKLQSSMRRLLGSSAFPSRSSQPG